MFSAAVREVRERTGPGSPPITGAAPERSFAFGSIEVHQFPNGTFSILDAEDVPADHFFTFVEMLNSFVKRAATKPSIEEPTDRRLSETLGESECPECHGIKQDAKNDLRRCSNCGTQWRVVPKFRP